MEALIQLHVAVKRGDAAGVAAALADRAVHVNGVFLGSTALYEACCWGHLECAKLLLASGADHTVRHTVNGRTALHAAALGHGEGHVQCLASLLAAGADPLATATSHVSTYVGPGQTPLHIAAAFGSLAAARLLAEAAPAALKLVDNKGQTALATCIHRAASLACSDASSPGLRPYVDTARYLLSVAPPAPNDAALILSRLAAGQQWLLPLLPHVAAHVALTSQQWAALPSPCPGLGAALPAVLRRSEAEAAQLVRRLPPASQQLLSTLALSLGAAAQRGRLPPLPTPIVQHVLAEAAAYQGQQEVQREQDQALQQERRQRRRARLLQPFLSALILASLVPEAVFMAAAATAVTTLVLLPDAVFMAGAAAAATAVTAVVLFPDAAFKAAAAVAAMAAIAVILLSS